MLYNLRLENILFLDIETIPEVENYGQLDAVTQELFAHKTSYQRKEDVTPEEFYAKAGIWAEFGKIVCISVGFITNMDGERQFRVRSFYGEEKKLLQEFKDLLEAHYNNANNLLCAHNGKEFDFPFLCRRMIIQGMQLPKILQFFGKKPWEIPHLDTLDLWKFGDYKHYTSLKLLTHILKIPSPKDDLDGSQVREVFYKENDMERIVNYCEKDTIAVAQIVLRLQQKPILEPHEIVSV